MMKKRGKGFSILELLIAVGLTGFVALGVASVMSFFRSQMHKTSALSEADTSGALGSRFLWIHFKNASPSFNFLRGSEFKDDQGLQFYDLCPDYPSSAFTGSIHRIVTLKPGQRTSFIVLVMNKQVRDTAKGYSNLFYADPALFYDFNGSTGIFSKDKVLAYLDAQNPKVLKAVASVPAMIDFYSPAIVRGTGQAATLPPSFPNPVSMVTSVLGNDLKVDNFGGLVQYTNALSGGALNSLDEFIRQIPPAGGGIPLFMIRAVRLFKYEIVAHQAGQALPTYDLQYSEWNGSTWVSPVMIATDVLALTLSRENITDSLISAKLDIKGK